MSRPFAEVAPVMLSTVRLPAFEYDDARPEFAAGAGGRGWSNAARVVPIDQHSARLAAAKRRHFQLEEDETLKGFTVEELRTWIDGLKAQRARLQAEHRDALAANRSEFEAAKPRAVAAASALVSSLETHLGTLEATSDVFFGAPESPLPALKQALQAARNALAVAEIAQWSSRGLELVIPPVGDSLSAAIQEGERVLADRIAIELAEDAKFRERLARCGVELPV